MEETTAQEHLTGEELEAEAEPDRSPPASAQEQASVTELKAQIQALKAQLASAQPVAVPPPPPKTPSLFNVGVTPKVSAADWTKLKQLAGSPPPRVGATETRRSLPATTQMAQFETDYVEEEREVAEPGVAGLELPAQIQSADPAQQLMFLQMQQNAVLLQKLVTKHSDPVLGALSGGSASDSGGGSSSGVKGCLAREVFLRAVQDLTKVADSTRANLLRELGIPASREDGNLMRKYVERKIPLAEHRLLSQFAFMIAESWNIGFESQNIELLGVFTDDVFCGTGCNRAGTRPDCMAFVRMAGTSVPNPSIAQETQRPATVLPDLQPKLDFRQFSLCQRFGLYGKPAIRKCKGIKSHSASRGRAVSSAQTAAPESQNRPFPRREVPRN